MIIVRVQGVAHVAGWPHTCVADLPQTWDFSASASQVLGCVPPLQISAAVGMESKSLCTLFIYLLIYIPTLGCLPFKAASVCTYHQGPQTEPSR